MPPVPRNCNLPHRISWDSVQDPKTPKPLMLAAIEAIGSIRPKDARKNLGRLRQSKDEDIAAAADEAITLAESAAAFEEGEDGGDWIN